MKSSLLLFWLENVADCQKHCFSASLDNWFTLQSFWLHTTVYIVCFLGDCGDGI